MKLFGRTRFLNTEDEDWHTATWLWFLQHFGGISRLRETPLVLPSKQFVPPTETQGHERALHIFDTVKHLAGMADWPCEVVPQPKRPEAKVGDFAILKTDSGAMPLGTFRAEKNIAAITYDPDSLGNPVELIATFAHELAHYRLASIAAEVPGGHDLHELTTDLLTIYMGFGLFGANNAFSFSQHQDFQSIGWQYSRRGYLRERDWIFGLAIFARLRGQEIQPIQDFLKPHLYADLVKAGRYLERHTDVMPDPSACHMSLGAQMPA